ncbi:CDP-diacylglycerol--glycerol-3-phosphate 3-phosphatidyltransferase [Candidatus Parabeggiatoa sp. HSG14]|uniref:CDP-diacylglycerol--glycerol-3-phosphate 3-phosphatidyltransferase n=1 Tax=Candidatus Parabeggiatoa sp. HSG14 TaxID=3055593 RepID=UPI0025A72F47|nr:CDP-diacylglycerol--glycerol-3-phosphate 3-phosphatidyltransferase [Thiotrichales bacterium HSG14]
MNIPNILTLLRILLIPVFVGVFYLPWGWANELTTLVFALAAITDWFDGYLARRWNQTSAFGAFLDPVADKLIVAVALVFLVQITPTPWMAIPAAIIIGREITISALREWMAEIGQRAKVAVSMVGKIKTTAQMMALLMLLLAGSDHELLFGLPLYEIGFVSLYIAAILTLWSMIVYLQAAAPILLEENKKEEKKEKKMTKQ